MCLSRQPPAPRKKQAPDTAPRPSFNRPKEHFFRMGLEKIRGWPRNKRGRLRSPFLGPPSLQSGGETVDDG